MHHQKSYTLLYFFVSVLMLTGIKASCQNVSSPYSILGIGDIDTKDYGRFYATGSASIARREPLSYNFANPASLTALPYKVMNFDIAMRGRVSTFQTSQMDTTTAASKDFAVKRITMAFKISAKTGIAFGLRPYSSVNYQFENSQAILDGNSSIIKSIDGSGGINQVYFSIGRSLGKHADSSKVSIGLTASYLFGSLSRATTFSGTSLLFSIVKQETNFLYGANVLGGIQFSSASPGNQNPPKWVHHVGLTGSISSQLNGQVTTDYTDNTNPTVPPVSELVANTQFKMPVSVGFGYSVTGHDAITFSADVNYSKWPNQPLDYPNSYTTAALRVSGGIEYSKKIPNTRVEKYFLGVGFSGENSYAMVNNNYLKDYAVSFGGGYNFSPRFTFYGGLEIGNKGNLNSKQIKEDYTSFVIGFTLKDIWYGTKKFGKFN